MKTEDTQNVYLLFFFVGYFIAYLQIAWYTASGR